MGRIANLTLFGNEQAEINACLSCNVPRPKCDGTDQPCLFFEITVDPELVRRRKDKAKRTAEREERRKDEPPQKALWRLYKQRAKKAMANE